jgi:hypothetical protein
VSEVSTSGADDTAEHEGRQAERRRRLPSRALLAAVVAVVVFAAVAAFVWVLQSGDSDDRGTPAAVSGSSGLGLSTGGATVPGVAAEVVSIARLRRIVAAAGRPVYWVGPQGRTRIEYTQTRDGTTYVRYLTGSATAGAPGAGYIVVATYLQPDAYRRVKRIAQAQHMFVADLPGGAIAVTKPSRPQNIHVVYPGRPYQIEVYAPKAAEGRKLVFEGSIQPVR